MRTYAPATAEAVLERLLADPEVSPSVVHHAVLPARPADLAPFPAWLDGRIRDALRGRGIEALYRHQAEALEEIGRAHV